MGVDAEKARTLEPSLFTPLLLSDSDVIFQCSPAELLSRYKSFNAPLVASVEKLYSPRPPGPSWTFSEDYNPFDNPPEARQSGMRYPNSGLILGTRMGFSALSRDCTLYPHSLVAPRAPAAPFLNDWSTRMERPAALSMINRAYTSLLRME